MRGFLVLCLVAVATADKLGYNYQPVGHDVNVVGGFGGGYSGGNGGFSGALNIVSIGGGYTGAGSIGAGPISGGSIADGYNKAGPIGAGSIGGGAVEGGSIGGASFDASSIDAVSFGVGASAGAGLSEAPVGAGYSKEFFFHSAPEEDSYEADATQQIASTLKKNLRVIFINAPENNGLSKAAIQLAKHAIEDKTAIYVLSKQHDISELANQLQVIKETHSQKPEVHFVKYQTQEDAVRAQKSIQEQYESLGGTSHNSNEGVAPVLNFVSQHQADAGVSSPIGGSAVSHSIAGQAASGYSIGGGQISSGPHASAKDASSYLPPIAKF